MQTKTIPAIFGKCDLFSFEEVKPALRLLDILGAAQVVILPEGLLETRLGVMLKDIFPAGEQALHLGIAFGDELDQQPGG